MEDAKDLGGAKSAVQAASVGLLLLGKGKWSQAMLNKAFPGLGPALVRYANGARPSKPAGLVDFGSDEAGTEGDEGAPFLLRLLESGFGGFSLDQIGENEQIDSLEALRAALDGLDAVPGNVTLTEANGVSTFNVQILKSLEGQARHLRRLPAPG